MIKTIITALICSVAVVVLAQTWTNHGDGRYSYSGTFSADDVLHATICFSNATEVLSVTATPTTLTNYAFASELNGFTVSLTTGGMTPQNDGSYDITVSHSVLGMGAAATYTVELYIDDIPSGYRLTQTVSNQEVECGSFSATTPLPRIGVRYPRLCRYR